MGSAVIPCSVWDRALWVLHETQDPLAAHPKTQTPAWTPVHPEKWGGPCLIQQQSLSINLGSQGPCQGSGEWQICYRDRFTGAGPWPHVSPSPPAPSPPSVPPGLAHLLAHHVGLR